MNIAFGITFGTHLKFDTKNPLRAIFAGDRKHAAVDECEDLGSGAAQSGLSFSGLYTCIARFPSARVGAPRADNGAAFRVTGHIDDTLRDFA